MSKQIFTHVQTVSDRISKSEYPDSIVITDKTPLEYWCSMLNCEKSDLLYAITNIGSSYTSVDYFLILNRRKNN